jgi:1-acyl-sn-glycerol-3-phosphate acyltransferase
VRVPDEAEATPAAPLATPSDATPGDVEGDARDAPAPPPRPKRRRRATPAAARAGRTRGPATDAFGERLRALEREIDEALAGIGGSADQSLVTAARDAADGLLSFYADLARAFWDGGVAEAFIRIRMIATADHVDDFGYDAAFAARMAVLLEFLYGRWWRVEMRGAEHVPATGRVMLVANHSGGFLPYDGLMMAHGLRTRRGANGRLVRPLVEDFVHHLPWVGPALTRMGAVRASAENAERLLRDEHAVAVFPEGAKGVGKYYRDRYRLQRFARGGFVTLALRTGAPVVPVAIIGGEEIHPVIAKWEGLARLLNLPYVPVTPTFPWLGLAGLVPLPTKWRIVYGPPIDLAAEYGADAADDDLLVNRLKEQVRERVQRMVVEELRLRDSVFG